MNLLKPTIALLIYMQAMMALAQKPPVKFSKDIMRKDLEMTHYEKDSSASAVILCDYGRSWIDYGTDQFQVKHERVTRIKILTKDGYKYADHSFNLYKDGSSKEIHSGLKGYTYNLVDGKLEKTKLDKSSIFEEEVDENHEKVKFTMPAVQVGSIIEFTYEITSDFLFNYQGWQFQYDIPVVWSEYRAKFIEYYNYHRDFQGYLAPTINETSRGSQSFTVTTSAEVTMNGRQSGSIDTYTAQSSEERLVLQNIPAFVEEPNLTTIRDYISMVNYELEYIDWPGRPIKRVRGTWESVNKEMNDNSYFGGRIKGNLFLNSLVDETINEGDSEQVKIEKIFATITNRMSWDGTNSRYAINSLKQAFDEGKGSSADINLLLVSALSKADINAEPVLVSTRNHGMIKDYKAVTSQFNYVICKATIGDQYVLLDATEKYLGPGILPERCLNGKGLVISENGPSWVELNSDTKRQSKVSGLVSITENGELNGNINSEYVGYSALSQRKTYFSKGEEGFKEDLMDYAEWEIDSIGFKNAEDISQSFEQNLSFSNGKEAESMGDIIYLNPVLVNRIDNNPYKLEERLYPVSYPSLISRDYYVTFEIPEGYVIDEMPEATNTMMPNRSAQFVYRIIPMGSERFAVLCQFKINKTLFVQNEYVYLKAFYAHVVDKMGEQIVLKKSKA